MNKTVSINIGGFIFHIEEEAYNKLGKYLDTISSYFSESEGRDEIMGDIEARIAEMFNKRVGNTKQVITMKDVDEVIEIMGQPEAYIDEEAAEEAPKRKYYQDGNSKTKRVFRDPDNQIVAGVCGGLAAYFNVDPVWFRLAFVLAVIFGGTGVLLYIILWIVIPEAKTTAEKLEMRGENVNIENIEKTIREEIDSLKDKFNDMSEGAKAWGDSRGAYQTKNFLQKSLDLFIQVIKAGFKIFVKVVGALLVFLGILLLVVFIGGIFGLPTISVNGDSGGVFRTALNSQFFEFFGTTSQVGWGMISLILLVGIPLVLMVYSGVKLLFNIKYRNKLIGTTAGILWSIGLAVFIVVCIQVGKDFASAAVARQTEVFAVPADGKALRLDVLKNAPEFEEIDFNDSDLDDADFLFNETGNFFYDDPKFDIVKSETDSFVLEIVRRANGPSKKLAYKRAANISYGFTQSDSTIVFDQYFKVSKEDKWRDQTVKIRLKIPVGGTIYLSNSMKHIIYDIDNVSNTWDGDMINRRWIMTDRGLQCVDCDNLRNINYPEPPAPPAPSDAPEIISFEELETLPEFIELPENDFSDIHKYDKSKERFDYEMKKKLNEIFFEMRNNPKPNCS